MAFSDTTYQGRAVQLLPGRYDAGSKRLMKIGLSKNRDGAPILVKSDVSAPTSTGRAGCHTKWTPMKPMSEDVYWRKVA